MVQVQRVAKCLNKLSVLLIPGTPDNDVFEAYLQFKFEPCISSILGLVCP